MKATIVFQKNREAILKPCETCAGIGTTPTPAGNSEACDWCGGSGKHWRYIINTGSSRSSKTASLIQVCNLYALENAHKRVTVWRDTQRDCKKTVLKDMQSYEYVWGLNKFTQSFNKTESIYTYPNNSTFEIHGTDDEVKVMGLNKSVAWLNEPYKISRDTFDQIDMRTDDFVIIDWNPRQGHWIEEIAKDPRAITLHSTFKDNPFCPPEQKRKILSYQPLKRCRIVEDKALSEQEARLYDTEASPLNFSPAALKELNRCRQNEEKNSANDFFWLVYGLGIKGERPNRIYNWKQIPDSDYHLIDAPIYIGCDWGSVDPFAIVEVKYYDGALYLHQRNYASETELQRHLNTTDRSQFAGKEEGLVTWLFKRLGIRTTDPVICDNNRLTKVAALRFAGYQAHLATKVAGSIVDGISLLQGIPVFFTASSTDLNYEQENYARQTDRYGIVLEEPEDVNNHICDAVRYVAMHLQKIGVIKMAA